MCWSLINVYVFKWVIWIPFAVFYVYLLYFIGLSYILKSTCYLWNTYISMKSYQLNQITFFNTSNSSYHFKLMGCSSLPCPHRYRHKSQDESVTKVTTIHFTPERSSPPVIHGFLFLVIVKKTQTNKIGTKQIGYQLMHKKLLRLPDVVSERFRSV